MLIGAYDIKTAGLPNTLFFVVFNLNVFALVPKVIKQKEALFTSLTISYFFVLLLWV